MPDLIRAIHFNDRDAFVAQALPGSVHFDLLNDAMWAICPCGCGARIRLAVGREVKPATSPSWLWNGSLTEPTLSPSVNRLECGWHGWLRDGYWEAV